MLLLISRELKSKERKAEERKMKREIQLMDDYIVAGILRG